MCDCRFSYIFKNCVEIIVYKCNDKKYLYLFHYNFSIYDAEGVVKTRLFIN